MYRSFYTFFLIVNYSYDNNIDRVGMVVNCPIQPLLRYDYCYQDNRSAGTAEAHHGQVWQRVCSPYGVVMNWGMFVLLGIKGEKSKQEIEYPNNTPLS